MNLIFIDIEVSKVPEPEQWLIPDVATMPHPGTMSKPETIAKWRDEKAATVVEDVRDESSLHAVYGGIIVCVGVAVEDAPAKVLAVDAVTEAAERHLLERLQTGLCHPTRAGHRVVAFNGHDYDFAFLRHRALRHGLWPLARRLWAQKPWDTRLIDPHKVWQGSDKRTKGKLVEIARYLGIPVTDTTTADVQAMLDAGRLDQVVEHCRCDVETLRQVTLRFAAAGWIEGIDPDSVPELEVRPPRPGPRTPEQEARALMVDMHKQDVRAACLAAEIEWDGGLELPEAGPLLTASVTTQQMTRFVLELQRRRAERGAA